MMQKYGAEVYGISTQHKNQRSNGGFSASGYSEAYEGKSKADVKVGGLIECTVTALPELPEKFYESSSGEADDFANALNEFMEYLEEKSKDSGWVKDYGDDVDVFKTNKAKFRAGLGTSDSDNVRAWDAIREILETDKWKQDIRDDSNLKKIVGKIYAGWDTWSEEKVEGPESSVSGEEWTPELPFKLEVKTRFDENWFKRKYKSGVLNGIIDAIKTGVM